MDWVRVPHKQAFHLAKYHNGRTPADGPPDEVVEVSQWFEADGTAITSQARIDELEAKVREQHGEG